ncbi:hypothetical protein [Sinorhizobium meliloti]|uniref:hypothetical protein n=1 Tax=Rhizobium meliloti TaxID=382 RepID=UPI001F228D25|nr:hypothetical protein [Sinorhizobium meliloti]
MRSALRSLAPFDDDRVADSKQPEATRIGAQREAITSALRLSSLAIHLFDGVHLEPTLHQRLDRGPVRHLDCDLDFVPSTAPLVAISQVAISANPSPPCL